jgi:predicted amidohydrolase
MRVAFVQNSPEFGKVKDNIDKVLSLMASKPADLYILPELFATGYNFTSKDELAKLSEEPRGGYTYKIISDFARINKTAIIYGFAEKASDGIYNSSVFVDSDRNFKLYRKLHLFYNEKRFFTPGNLSLEVFDYRDAKLGMMVCFDWIFPELPRCLALMGADVICHPANLVMPYCQNAMVTRSVENRIFTITANRIGQENRGGLMYNFTGKSQVTDCQGNVIYRASEDKVEVYCADINIKEARNKYFNSLNNLWEDRRIRFYGRLGE